MLHFATTLAGALGHRLATPSEADNTLQSERGRSGELGRQKDVWGGDSWDGRVVDGSHRTDEAEPAGKACRACYRGRWSY